MPSDITPPVAGSWIRRAVEICLSADLGGYGVTTNQTLSLAWPVASPGRVSPM